jgi:hypothetical protein
MEGIKEKAMTIRGVMLPLLTLHWITLLHQRISPDSRDILMDIRMGGTMRR